MQVFVNNSGDLTKTEIFADLMLAVKSFKKAPGSIGAESTHLWLKAFIPFIGFNVNILYFFNFVKKLKINNSILDNFLVNLLNFNYLGKRFHAISLQLSSEISCFAVV